MGGRTSHAVLLFLLLLLPNFSAASSNLQSMVTSISVAGYTQFAQAIRQANISEAHTTTGCSLTYFAPSDTSLIGLRITPDFIRYHIVSDSKAFTYGDLVGIAPGMRLQTLLDNATLLVTESMGDLQRFSVNKILVDVPNIYFDGNSSVHGLKAPLGRLQQASAPPPHHATRKRAKPPVRQKQGGERYIKRRYPPQISKGVR